MTELTRTFDTFRVTLDTDMGDGATGCWIQKDGFSASLEAADAMGVLTDNNDQELPIHSRTVQRIRDWAEQNGY